MAKYFPQAFWASHHLWLELRLYTPQWGTADAEIKVPSVQAPELKLTCCFTSTETVGLFGTGAQDGHLDFHTAPKLCPQS